MKGLILYIVAAVLFLPLTVLNVFCVIVKNGNANGYFFQGAIDIDKFGNINLRCLLNTILRKKGGSKFGLEDETISSVLGKNKRDDKLSFIGVAVACILDSIDKNHCIKSIKK